MTAPATTTNTARPSVVALPMFHQAKGISEPQERCREACSQQASPSQADEHIQQEESVVLQQNEECQRDACMVKHQLVQPRPRLMLSSEVDEGHREQEERHGREKAHAGTMTRGGATCKEHGPHHCQCAKSIDDRRDARCLRDDRQPGRIREMDGRGCGADHVPDTVQPLLLPLQCRVQKSAWQEAQDGQANCRHDALDRAGGVDEQHDQGAEVPAQCQARPPRPGRGSPGAGFGTAAP